MIKLSGTRTEPVVELCISYVHIAFNLSTCQMIVAALPHQGLVELYGNEYWSDWKRHDILASIDHFVYELEHVWS